MLGFVPPLKAKKNKRDVDIDMEEEVKIFIKNYFMKNDRNIGLTYLMCPFILGKHEQVVFG